MTRTLARLALTAAILAAALFAFATTASAVTLTPTTAPLSGSNFQGGDGNQDDPAADVSDPPDGVTDVDWANVGSSAISSSDFNALDTAFIGGNKESAPGAWGFTTQAAGVNPNKDNLLAAWSESAPSVSGVPNTFLNLAFTREAQTGNTFITFELNQSPHSWDNGQATIACRQSGDLLISYNVASGGTPPNVDIVVYQWTTDTGVDVKFGDDTENCAQTGHFDPVDPQNDAEAGINGKEITNYLTADGITTPFAAGTFGETSLNLTGILTKANLNPCESFGQISMHTRSSTSIDSQLQDYIAPVPIVTRSCGVHIEKSGESPKHDSDPETFSYAVTNTGTQPVAVDKATGVTDDKCLHVAYVGGDSNHDGMLDINETWQFTCAYTVQHSDENDQHEIVNVATVTGMVGAVQVTDSDTYTTLVIHPAIDVRKHVDKDTARAGDTLSYTVDIENTGDTALTVTPADAGCDGFALDAFSLDPGETHTLSCTKVVPGGVTEVDNTASADGVDVLGKSVSDSDTVATTIVKYAPQLATQATANATLGQAISDTANLEDGYGLTGQEVSFTVYGPNDSDCTGHGTFVGTGAIDEHGNAQSPEFTPTAPGVYRWVASYLADANNESVTGACNDPGETSIVDENRLAIVKTGPDHAYDGDQITFDIAVSNPGTTPISDVVLSDQIKGTTHGCDSLSAPAGDTNGDGLLDTTETWHYTCRYTVQHGDEDATHHVDNVATVSGKSPEGADVGPVSDDAAVLIVHPAIAIDKSGPISADPGDKVAYTLTITNPGDESFAESTVQLADEQCNGDPVTLIGKGGDATPASFDPGDTWTYTCSVQTAAGDVTIHNVASVLAADQFGKQVGANDSADTLLVLGERQTGSPKGAARLLGPTGCTSRAFNARVRGKNIASVVFVLDGKVVKRLKKPNAKGLFSMRVNPKGLRLGVHRLVANVTFTAATRTKPKTMRLSFQRCAKKLIAPRFTG